MLDKDLPLEERLDLLSNHKWFVSPVAEIINGRFIKDIFWYEGKCYEIKFDLCRGYKVRRRDQYIRKSGLVQNKFYRFRRIYGEKAIAISRAFVEQRIIKLTEAA